MENMILKHMDVVRGITISILEKQQKRQRTSHQKGSITIFTGILDTLPLFKKSLCLA